MGNILTFEDLQTEGLDSGTYKRPRVELLILQAEEQFAVATRRIFHKIDNQVLYADGCNSDELKLEHPAISVDTVEINSVELEASAYEIVTSLPVETALFNPKLRRIDGVVWPRGTRNVKVTGSFGFVLSDGQSGYVAPRMVKRAIALMVIEWLPKLSEAIGAGNKKRIISESISMTTYSYSLSEQSIHGARFENPEIYEIIADYRKIGMAAV